MLSVRYELCGAHVLYTGLLIKQMLVSAAETSSHSTEHAALVDNTRGVVFYSVPHNGSALADYSTRPSAAYLLYPSVEIRDLRAGARATRFQMLVHRAALQQLSRVSLIYRMEPTTKKWKNRMTKK